ncbi:Integrator complex subunit 1 [Saguinus oedipus]|uniref:Integrator complex subunit 1 n=1 Tax=Saguinus oedipus TaxID=9490 RepID=A0ABQ9W4K5_SAGOE|nr:Integrator complex subunit 1 [Saguinus oedipus]
MERGRKTGVGVEEWVAVLQSTLTEKFMRASVEPGWSGWRATLPWPRSDLLPTVLLDEIEAAELEGNDDRIEGVLCGAVKQLKVTRAKPDSTLYLSLMYLAKIKPNIFATEGVIEALCSLLRRDASINFKAKGNSLVSVLACNLLMAAYEEDENWPEIFVKASGLSQG